MRKLLILFCHLAIAFRPKQVNETCPDADLGEICDGHCFSTFLSCKDDCESGSCERECLFDYTDCYSNCPCYQNCENGCVECMNPICSCVSPEKDNAFYQHCIDESQKNFGKCVKACVAQEICYDACYSDFIVSSRKCPCNAGCELGCPCESGYDCQPFIMALCQSSEPPKIDFGYVISADGNFKENRFYTSQQGSFIERSGHAVLNGEMFIFGGLQNPKKIGKIDECNFVDTGMKLINDFLSNSGALVTVHEIHDETILCRGEIECEGFDGVSSKPIASTKEKHFFSCMALYDSQPIIIAGIASSSVEALAVTGWQTETKHPSGTIRGTTCVSLDHGVLVIGGYVDSHQTKAYSYTDSKWSMIGEMKQKFYGGSMILFDDFFLVFAGIGGGSFAVERAEWNGEKITSSEVLFHHENGCYRPIVFETYPDHCENFCSDDFCYV
ncbi:Oidioi.mRNA.OKI2018_I69.chr1.g878.t1.cds [Oikopleura dioica]|uniref:Oidioi.mRNA.OKI2018_I69.chr1.g878.t1.cds n=1 Tax=Oikopleura dioica TaxID=34765 RepID=A0ABN7SQJ3_OIKDI|nr:Oidioi.mRNA.OKI2018_I69.chr1.g878.t1.cds [Oikopleura dioica]